MLAYCHTIIHRIDTRQYIGDTGLIEQGLRGTKRQDVLAVAIVVGHDLQRLPTFGQQLYPHPFYRAGRARRKVPTVSFPE